MEILFKCARGPFGVALVIMAVCVARPAWASEQLIRLTDGSRILGEVVGMHDGKYSIQTKSLGLVKVESERVESISSPGATGSDASATSASSTTGEAVKQIESVITSNPSLMSQILRLQSDPDMQAALRDPEIMRAVQSFDLDALMKNPKFQALLNNPAIQSIQSDVK